MTEEEKWCRRLKRVVDNMPETLEVCICLGTINVYSNGSIRRSFEQSGDADEVGKYSEFNFTIYDTGFYGNEESI